MLRLEFCKAIRGKGFRTSLILGIALSILHAFWVSDYLEQAFFRTIRENGKGAYFNADPSFMQGWIGMDVFSTYGSLFYLTLFPLLAALPYAASLLREEQLGYEKNVMIRSGKTVYFMTKFITAFITGGIVVTVPAVLSLGIAMSYLPLIPVEPLMYQTGITSFSLWGEIFYRSPLLYAVLYLLLDFVIAGVFSVLSLTICWRMKNVFLGMVLPMMLNLALPGVLNLAPGFLKELCPLIPYVYICPGGIGFCTGRDVVAGLLLIFFGAGCMYGIRAKKGDVLS